MTYEHCCCGIISAIKLLPAIPPSAFSWANCVILSQIWPNIFGDGYNKGLEENSIYGVRLNAGYSQNIIDFSIAGKVSPEEQFRAFNDIAHFRGLKTGFRVVISADQMKIAHPDGDDEGFDWCNADHQELWINECVKLCKLGFEAIFIDSAKHIGGYDCEKLYRCRRFAGIHPDAVYLKRNPLQSRHDNTQFCRKKKVPATLTVTKNLGLTAGTAFINPDDYETRERLGLKSLNMIGNYAPGIVYIQLTIERAETL